MDIRYFLDADTGQPHIYGHGVTEAEVEDVFRSAGDDLPAAGTSRMKLGRTAAGRYLQVIYVPDDDPRQRLRGDRLRTPGEGRAGVPASPPEEGPMSRAAQQFPAGWDEAQVRAVLDHYDGQTEDEQAADIEAALEADGVTLVAVPAGLADEVRALIARWQGDHPART